MLFSWFDAREAEQFGLLLADTVVAKFPPAKAGKEKKVDLKRAEFVQHIFLQARYFRQTHPLNIYKKAKLGNAFKWRLLDVGYEASFVDQLTREVLIEI